MRVELLREEEYLDALDAGDVVAVADALADMLYVIYGARRWPTASTCTRHWPRFSTRT